MEHGREGGNSIYAPELCTKFVVLVSDFRLLFIRASRWPAPHGPRGCRGLKSASTTSEANFILEETVVDEYKSPELLRDTPNGYAQC